MLPMLLVLSAGLAEAQVYKWQDDQGRVHYGSRPPASVPAEAVKIEEAPAPSPDAGLRASEKALFDEVKAREREAAKLQQKAAERDAERRVRATRMAADRQERCAHAQRRLNNVEYRLRAGYAPDAGPDLHSRQDEYRRQIEQYCD
jgi:hypothetical protein